MSQYLKEISGSCLCGEVTFVVSGEVSAFHLCHCSRCRRSTGTAHASNIFTKPENITWLSGTENIRRYEHPTAETFAKQFCSRCGSGLPYINRPGTALVIPAGSLKGDPGVTPQDNIFWGSRVQWYDEGIASIKCEEFC